MGDGVRDGELNYVLDAVKAAVVGDMPGMHAVAIRNRKRPLNGPVIMLYMDAITGNLVGPMVPAVSTESMEAIADYVYERWKEMGASGSRSELVTSLCQACAIPVAVRVPAEVRLWNLAMANGVMLQGGPEPDWQAIRRGVAESIQRHRDALEARGLWD